MPKDDNEKENIQGDQVESDLEAAQKQIQEALGQSNKEIEKESNPLENQGYEEKLQKESSVNFEQSDNSDFFEEEQNKKNIDNSCDTESEIVDTVTVQPIDFMSFDNDVNPKGADNKNLEILMDIKLELSVELGRCKLPIKRILELTRDSIIELDKVAGEPVSLFANGKHIANGEIVVIEDNFAIRITSIIEPEKRLKSLD